MNDGSGGNGELHFKVIQLEKAQNEIKEDQKALRGEVQQGFLDNTRALREITDKVTAQRSPNWQLVVAAASFMFLVITGFVTMIKGPADQRITALEVTSASHTALLPAFMTKEDYRNERDRNFGIVQKQIDATESRETMHDQEIEHKLDRLEDRFEIYRTHHER